jgi:hypothetical protein
MASKYTEELAGEILARVADGEPLAQVLRDLGIGHTTWYDWTKAHEALAERIARAREVGYDVIAVDALKIADDSTRDTIDTERGPRIDSEWVARSKLRVETRLKLLAKWDPKRYGEKLAVGGATDLPPIQQNTTVEPSEAYKLLLGRDG